MAGKKPESEPEKAARRSLQRFLQRTHRFLQAVHAILVAEGSQLTDRVRGNISTLWHDASSKLQNTITSLDIGTSQQRRNDLEAVGLFGDAQQAKEGIFDFLLSKKRFVSALKLLASVFGSLSRVFHILSAVKEFIDAALTVLDWLPDPELSGLTTLDLS
jgi:hypothetical protein